MRSPLHRTQEPGGGDPGEAGARCAVEVERGPDVALQERRRDLMIHLALHRAAHDVRLVLSSGEDHDLAGLEDGPHAHRDRFPRHVVLAEEVGGGVLAGDEVQRDETGPALEAAAAREARP